MIEDRIESIRERGNLPGHIAIIMDGNGRWAKSRNLPRVEGHREGVKSVREIVATARKLGLKALTLYTFSSENWKRPKTEVSALMSLLLSTIRKETDELRKNNVSIRVIGNLEDLPEKPKTGMIEAIEKTRSNDGLILNLALSYSSRVEIISAVRSIAEMCKSDKLNPEQIDETVLSQSLYTAGLDDPDLLIRTSGELRISNFLLWQIAYSEIYFTETLWPDFRENEFLEAVENYQTRERRFGQVSEQLKSKMF